MATSSVPAVAGGQATSKPVEIWECRDFFADDWKNILVRATVDSGRTKGTIAVAGVTHEAKFQVEGFDRRWDFGLSAEGRYRYAFTIEPNGDAKYFDFGSGNEMTAKASNLMKCREKK